MPRELLTILPHFKVDDVAMSLYSIINLPCLLGLPLSVPFLHPVRCCIKSDPSYDDVKVELRGVHSHLEDVQLELNPAYGEVTPSQAQTDPQPYEEFIPVGGVTSDSVAMEENPAYQSVDTTVPQTEEPVYL